MRYRTMKCNNCNKYIERHQHYSGKQFGNPFKQCPHCGQWYIDESFDEPALFTEKEVFYEKIKYFFALLICVCPFVFAISGLIVYYIVDGNSIIAERFGLVFTICYFIRDLYKSNLCSRNINKAMEESFERLQDENYYNLLLKTGWVNPPDSYYNKKMNSK